MEIDILTLLGEALLAIVLAVPVAVCSWTIAKEEVFAWLRSICKKVLGWGESHGRLGVFVTKPFYMPTCEYCTSFWVTLVYLTQITPLRMVQEGWRGLLIAEFFVMGFAVIYMAVYSRIRVETAKDKTITEKVNNGGNIERCTDLHGRCLFATQGDRVG